MIYIEDNPSNEIIQSLKEVETRTLFLFDNYALELHKEILSEIEKRGYLIYANASQTNH